jgi:hypothetical protein
MSVDGPNLKNIDTKFVKYLFSGREGAEGIANLFEKLGEYAPL